MTWRHLPNVITALRGVAAIPLLWLLQNGDFASAFWLALVAGLSDAVDGMIAKAGGWQTQLGGLLDPIADKLLLAATFIGLFLAGALPEWMLWMIVGRDVVILAGATVWWFWIGPFVPAPTLLSKGTTAVQIALALSILVHLGFQPLSLDLIEGVALACAAFTLASGIDYVFRYGYRAWHAKKL